MSVLRLYLQPAAAMSDILDRGSLLFTSTILLIVSWALGHALPAFPISFYLPLLVLAAFYVPGILVLSGLAGSGIAFQRDYAPMLTCAGSAFAAAGFPLLVIVWFQPGLFAIAGAAASLYFLVLMFFAVRTVFGTGNGTALGIVSVSWIPLVAAYFLWGPLQFLLGWLASPFFLFYIFFFLRGELGDIGAGLRRQQSFRRNLEAATVNPRDGEAQYQLGLIYQQRRQLTEAVRRFQNAVAADPSLTDAHFQLGRIARQQGRLEEALAHFQTVVNQDERHSRNEVLREVGALYLAVRRYEDARSQLADFVERREYDPEGLYYYGQALEGLGKTKEAREAYARADEAAKLAAHYMRRAAAKWGRLARRQNRKLANS
jgi:tetratricopeptide (TPR) repeat protein